MFRPPDHYYSDDIDTIVTRSNN